jgi:glutathione peroxidase
MRLATLRIFRPAFPAIARALIPAALALCVVGVASAADAKPTGPAATAEAPATAAACPALLRHEFPRLQDDAPQNLCQYAGKVLLVVNTASYCGFTSQYEGLEQLYARYQGKGLVVLGFPSNQFGQQEPGSSKDIADFCFNTYGVKFPMFAKSDVRGDRPTPSTRSWPAPPAPRPSGTSTNTWWMQGPTGRRLFQHGHAHRRQTAPITRQIACQPAITLRRQLSFQ